MMKNKDKVQFIIEVKDKNDYNKKFQRDEEKKSILTKRKYSKKIQYIRKKSAKVLKLKIPIYLNLLILF